MAEFTTEESFYQLLNLKNRYLDGHLLSFILIKLVFRYAVFKSEGNLELSYQVSSHLPCVKEYRTQTESSTILKTLIFWPWEYCIFIDDSFHVALWLMTRCNRACKSQGVPSFNINQKEKTRQQAVVTACWMSYSQLTWLPVPDRVAEWDNSSQSSTTKEVT